MKIINKDNFDRDETSDQLVCENINEYYGKALIEFLNDKFSGDTSSNYYVLKDDSYELYKWEP